MIQELDTVALTIDLPEHRLQKGDIGAIVHRYLNDAAFEVEFVTAGGETIAVLTLSRDQIRSLQSDEILHVRDPASV